MRTFARPLLALGIVIVCASMASAQRQMEPINRGVIAVWSNTTRPHHAECRLAHAGIRCKCANRRGGISDDRSAPIGSHILGTVSFSYDVYSGDPNAQNFDPYTQTVATGQLESAAFDVFVVPEPATVWLMAPVALVVFRFRRRSPRIAPSSRL